MSVKKQVPDTRLDSDVNNPCVKEHTLSMKCLSDNAHDRERCRNYFDNYKTCKTFWNYVYRERKKRGIRPFLPPPEERLKAKEEYFNDFRKEYFPNATIR